MQHREVSPPLVGRGDLVLSANTTGVGRLGFLSCRVPNLVLTLLNHRGSPPPRKRLGP